MNRDDLAWALAQRLNAISSLTGDEIAEHLVCPDCGGLLTLRVHPTKPLAVAWCPADDSHFWWSGQDVVRKPWMEKYVGTDGFATVQFDG